MATVSRKPCFTVTGLLLIIMISQLLAWTENFSLSGRWHSFDGSRNSRTRHSSRNTTIMATTTTSNLMHTGGSSSIIGPLLFELSGGDWKKPGRGTLNRNFSESYCLSVSVPAERSTARREPVVLTSPSVARSSFSQAPSQSVYHPKNTLGFAAVTFVKPSPPPPSFSWKIQRKDSSFSLTTFLSRNDCLPNGLEEENDKFIRKAQARKGQKGAAMDDITHTYNSRVRGLSDGLTATQNQLARLISDRNRERRESERNRKQLMTQVARLEAQLRRARQSVQQERAEMESILYRLSSVLAGVDAELMQFADTTSSPEAKRTLRQDRERFRLCQRSEKLLLEGQKRRYDMACQAMEREVQHLRMVMAEVDSLKANLAASMAKERDLKSSVWVLDGKISSLDKELRKARDTLDRERSLRRKAEVALFSTEERRKQEAVSLIHELEATRQRMATTRKVCETTVEQRQRWRQAKIVACERAKASESALQEEVTKRKCSAAEREREISELKGQVVRISRSLLTSEAEKRTQATKNLERDIERKTEEIKRKTVACTVTGVLSKTFINASQMSQAMAPHGFLAKLGEQLKACPRNSAVNTAPDPPSSPTDRRARVDFRDGAAPSAPNRASSKGSARAEKGLLRGLFGSETRAVDGITSGPRDKGATKSGSPPLGVRPPRKQERNRRENTGVLDNSRKTSTAIGDSGSLRTGSDSIKQPPENHQDVSTAKHPLTYSPAEGTAVVTCPPKSNQQEAKTRKRADQNHTTFGSKKYDPETTVIPAEEGGAVGSKTNDPIPGDNNVQAASKRLLVPRPQPQSSHTLEELPVEVKRHSSSVSSGAPLKASASAAASGAVKSISRVIPGGNNLAAAGKNGTVEADDASGAEQNGRGAVDEDMGSSRKHSHCTRDQSRQARWHDVDVLKVLNPHDSAKVAANSVRRGSDGGGNKSRLPWTSSVALPGGGYMEDTKDNNATPAVTASTLSATTASYGQNITGSGDTENAVPSLELQLHFIGVGA